MTSPRHQGLAAMLEAEFRQLSQDARKSEGLASFFSSADHPEVKEAAERAVLKIRSVAEAPDALEQIRNSKELLKPLQLACDTKSPKLVGHALSTAQKMLANGALSVEGTVAVVGMLNKVEKSSDENVQLKILQTALTLLQSPWHPTSMDDIATVLGTCFRMLSAKGHKDTVVSTATATVRQAVALVFSYVDVGAELARIDRVVRREHEELERQPAAAAAVAAGAGPQPEEGPATAGGQHPPRSSSADDAPFTSQDLEPEVASLDGSAAGAAQSPPPPPPQTQPSEDLQSPTVQAAHKLLEDLCAIAAGAPPQWLRTPSLPRTFVLEILDFVLTNSAPIFRSLPAFENTLSVWISQLLQSQLQDHLDAGAAGSSMAVNSFSTFRAVLRTTRTVLRGFYPQIGMRCGAMVQGLLRGLNPKIPLFQRIAVMQIIKQLLGDACFVYFLFSAYDMQPELKFEIVHATVQSCTDIVEGMLKAANKDPEDDPPLDLVMGMCHARAQGKDWTMDTDFEAAAVPVQSAYLSLLAIDALMAFMGSVEKLTDILAQEGGVVPATPRKTNPCSGPGSVERVDMETCRALVGRNWRKMLSVFRELLSRCSGEAMILLLLKGYQVFTQACGMLGMLEPRDAFLGTLCEFALASAGGETDTAPAAGRGAQLASPRGGASSGGGGADHEGGLVLAPKNVQSMRALFNIAHRLSNNLGPAWALVLETMNTLDTILHSPHTTTQEVSVQSGEEPMCSDVAILSAAASQMFECTSDMSREAVVSLLSGLRDVSIKHIPQAVQVQQPKLFALNRMVEVLLYNKTRIYDLWAIFLSHVLELASDSKAPVRAAAIEALDRAIVGTLGSPKQAVRRTDDEAESPVVADDAGGVEYMLLVAMESLYSGNAERDVQLGVLRVLLNVLQRHGEHLSDGWTPVFRLLASVPAQKEGERIDLAFQSVQLTCSDYMAAMPYARMKRSLEVAAMYGSQQVDLNVSLTAISLLWNAADMLGRSVGTASPEQSPAAAELAGAVPAGPTSPRGGDNGAVRAKSGRQIGTHFSQAEIEELLQMVFVSLQCLSMDLRPEVRNSGVRTLFAVIVNQGPRLSPELWERCLWEMMFPLLRHAYRMSANSDKEETEAQLLGSTRGKQVRLLVHHSRNSEQKQWDETVVIALGGMGRLLKAHLPAVVRLEGFPAAWEELMVVVESSMAGGRKEVALAAMTLLGGVLQAHAAAAPAAGASMAEEGVGIGVLTDAMWKRAMRALDVGVEAATTPGCQVPLQARIELVNMIGSAYSMLKPRFDEEDTHQVFFWLERLCKSPWSDDDAANTVQVAIGLPPVQKAVLALLPSLGPAHLPHLWPELLYMLSRFLKPHQAVEHWRQQQEVERQRAAALLLQQQAAAAAQQQQAAAAAAAGQPGGALPATAQLQPAAATLSGAQLAGEAAAGGAESIAGVGVGSSRLPQQPPPSQPKHALSSAFLEKVLEALVAIYRDLAPMEAKAITFPAVVAALGRCMEVRYSAYSEPLWRNAAQTFITVVPAGLPAVAAAYSAAAAEGGPGPQEPLSSILGDAVASGAAWAELAAAFEGFLLGAHAGGAQAEPAGDEAQASDGPAARAAGKEGSSGGEDPGMILAGSVGGGSSRQSSQGQEAAVGGSGGAAAAVGGAAGVDPAQCRADAELEVSVLDMLADVVLTAAGTAPRDMKLRFVLAVDGGICRSAELNIRQVATGANFSHVCLRKLYALCSRGGTSLGAASAFQSDEQVAACLLEVAQLALPVLLARCDAMLRAYLDESPRSSLVVHPGGSGMGAAVAGPRPRLDEVMCVLEVLASMTVVREVVDAALAGNEPIQQLVALLRCRPEVTARGRERTHLLLLYPLLCEGITCKEGRVREMVKDVLQLAGAELGLGLGCTEQQVLSPRHSLASSGGSGLPPAGLAAAGKEQPQPAAQPARAGSGALPPGVVAVLPMEGQSQSQAY